ncbi:MAG: helix-turn-helix transcriptional regulator [Clostridia bacterium]|nr:helix-turn-helix transcriptional regulator [Clostridia bacterium]
MREGEVLKLFRIVNGYDSLIDLAKATGLNKQTLSRAENNTAFISKATLQILADLYDVSYTALVLSFKLLEPLDYNIKRDRKKAYAHILSYPSKKR